MITIIIIIIIIIIQKRTPAYRLYISSRYVVPLRSGLFSSLINIKKT